MEQRISVITLGVKDIGLAKKFYEDVVGWQATESPGEIVFFDMGGVVFSLYADENLIKDFGGVETGGDAVHGGFTLAHNARSKGEVDRIFERLAAKGAKIAKQPEEVFWGGYSGYFEDLDGHKWEVAYNPFWKIDDDGRIVMVAQ